MASLIDSDGSREDIPDSSLILVNGEACEHCLVKAAQTYVHYYRRWEMPREGSMSN